MSLEPLAAREYQPAYGPKDMESGPAAVAANASSPNRTFSQRFADWFHYETERIVRIRNGKVSAIHIIAQLLIIGYIIGFGLIYKKSYQITTQASGSSRIKTQGVAYANGTLPWEGPTANASMRIYDAVDLTIPVIERNALFVTSNMWITLNQRRGTCPSYDARTNSCNTTTTATTTTPACSTMYQTPSGRQIGPANCLVNYTDPRQLWPQYVPKGGFCELYAWVSFGVWTMRGSHS